MTTQELIEQLKTKGGAIVTSDQCSVMEVTDAQATHRFAVDDEGIGYVRRYPEWLAIHKDCVHRAPNDLKISDPQGVAHFSALAENVTRPEDSLHRLVRCAVEDSEIVIQLEALADYYRSVRRVGHTTAMIEGVRNTSNALVLVSDARSAFWMKEKLPELRTVTLRTLAELRGQNAPLVMDNAAAYLLLSDAVTEIRKLNEKLRSPCDE